MSAAPRKPRAIPLRRSVRPLSLGSGMLEDFLDEEDDVPWMEEDYATEAAAELLGRSRGDLFALLRSRE